MGFFSSVGSAIKSTVKKAGRAVGKGVETVGKVTGNKKLEKTGQAIQEVCSETARKTGETQSYDKEKSRISETERMNKILADFSNQLKEKMDSLERASLRENRRFFDQLINEIKKHNRQGIVKINTKRIDRYRSEVENEIKGKLKGYLAKRVSLDDSECLEILKMDSGSNKQKRMKKFGDKVIQEGLNNLSQDIKNITNEQREFLEDILNDKMDEIVKNNEKRVAEFEEIGKLRDKDQKEQEKKKAQVQLTVDIANYAIEEVKN